MEEKITRIKAGSAFQVTDETRDTDDLLFTPSAGVSYDVYDPTGALVATKAMTETATTGKWRGTTQSLVAWVLGMYMVTLNATHSGSLSIKENKNAFELY